MTELADIKRINSYDPTQSSIDENFEAEPKRTFLYKVWKWLVHFVTGAAKNPELDRVALKCVECVEQFFKAQSTISLQDKTELEDAFLKLKIMLENNQGADTSKADMDRTIQSIRDKALLPDIKLETLPATQQIASETAKSPRTEPIPSETQPETLYKEKQQELLKLECYQDCWNVMATLDKPEFLEAEPAFVQAVTRKALAYCSSDPKGPPYDILQKLVIYVTKLDKNHAHIQAFLDAFAVTDLNSSSEERAQYSRLRVAYLLLSKEFKQLFDQLDEGAQGTLLKNMSVHIGVGLGSYAFEKLDKDLLDLPNRFPAHQRVILEGFTYAQPKFVDQLLTLPGWDQALTQLLFGRFSDENFSSFKYATKYFKYDPVDQTREMWILASLNEEQKKELFQSLRWSSELNPLCIRMHWLPEEWKKALSADDLLNMVSYSRNSALILKELFERKPKLEYSSLENVCAALLRLFKNKDSSAGACLNAFLALEFPRDTGRGFEHLWNLAKQLGNIPAEEKKRVEDANKAFGTDLGWKFDPSLNYEKEFQAVVEKLKGVELDYEVLFADAADAQPFQLKGIAGLLATGGLDWGLQRADLKPLRDPFVVPEIVWKLFDQGDEPFQNALLALIQDSGDIARLKEKPQLITKMAEVNKNLDIGWAVCSTKDPAIIVPFLKGCSPFEAGIIPTLGAETLVKVLSHAHQVEDIFDLSYLMLMIKRGAPFERFLNSHRNDGTLLSLYDTFFQEVQHPDKGFPFVDMLNEMMISEYRNQPAFLDELLNHQLLKGLHLLDPTTQADWLKKPGMLESGWAELRHQVLPEETRQAVIKASEASGYTQNPFGDIVLNSEIASDLELNLGGTVFKAHKALLNLDPAIKDCFDANWEVKEGCLAEAKLRLNWYYGKARAADLLSDLGNKVRGTTIRSLLPLFNDEKTADYKVHVEDKTLYCHKFIVGSVLEFFGAALRSNMKESLNEMTISGHSYKAVFAVMKAVYEGKIPEKFETDEEAEVFALALDYLNNGKLQFSQ